MKFRKKPVVIEAFQYQNNHDEVFEWARNASDGNGTHLHFLNGFLYVETLEGTMHVKPNDWVICGVKGEFYPCKPDIFEATYEAVTEPRKDE